MAVTSHPTPETLAAFARGDLPPGELSAVATHVGSCDTCCAVLRGIPDNAFGNPARDSGASPAPSASGEPAEPALTKDGDYVPPELANHPRYKVVGVLGAGGMGVVYKAHDQVMDRTVALKVMAAHLTAKPGAAERFNKEVRAAARLQHQNIVTAYDKGEAGNLHFLVMEYVEGMSLDRYVARKGQLATHMACLFARQAANGLQHAAERGLTHRDIKPQNLMAPRKGQIKVMDFGLARFVRNDEEEPTVPTGRLPFGAGKPVSDPLTNPNLVLGTPDYLSPEQARNSHNVDHRSDIYSLGCTLYYMLAGKPPFAHAATLIDKLLAHTEGDVPSIRDVRPDVPAGLAAVLAKMMAKKPEDRFQTAAEVSSALAPYSRADVGVPEVVEAVIVATPAVPPVAPQTTKPAPVRTRAELARESDTAPVPDGSTLVEAERPRKVVRKGKKAPRVVPWWQRKWVQIGAAAAVLLFVVVAVAARGKKTVENPPPDGGPAPSGNSDPKGKANATPPTVIAGKELRVLFVVPSNGLYWPDYGPVKERLQKTPGVKVTTVSGSGGKATLVPHAENPAPSIEVDGKLAAFTDVTPFAAVVFCGKDSQEYSWAISPASRSAAQVIEGASKQGKLLAGICLGEIPLAEHGALAGKEVAYNEMVAKKYGQSGEFTWKYNRSVWKDGLVITASGPEDNIRFADALLEAMKNK